MPTVTVLPRQFLEQFVGGNGAYTMLRCLSTIVAYHEVPCRPSPIRVSGITNSNRRWVT